jgi:NADH-quinone oxidoreductase subunit I
MTAPSASALARSSTTASAPFSLKDFLSSFMLVELFKGLALTGKYAFSRKITVQFPEEKTPLSPRFRGLHALRRYEKRRRALHRLQALRGRLPGAGDHDRIRCARRRLAPHHALRHRPDQVHLLRLLRESCPVDSIVETHIFEYHGEKRGDLYFTKDMLLAVGDRYEKEIAANKAADAKYR